MPVRLATYSDLDRISQITAASFYDEELNDHIFPYRKHYPADYVAVWKEKAVQHYWDYNKVWIVHYEESAAAKAGDVITGVAEWGREGEGSDQLWGPVRWWDPRRLISPILSWYCTLFRLFRRNRAIAKATQSNPNPINKWNFEPRLGPYLSLFLKTPAYRHSRWELCLLAVDPAYQRRGIGQELVAWGLARAKTDGQPAMVVGAEGTEPFYHRCGFVQHAGNVSTIEFEDDEDGTKVKRIDQKNPLKAAGIKGGAVMWTY